MNDSFTLEEIIHARDRCASIVAKYGKKYLPIFERLEKEVENRKKQDALFQKAIQIDAQNVTQNGTQVKKRFSKNGCKSIV